MKTKLGQYIARLYHLLESMPAREGTASNLQQEIHGLIQALPDNKGNLTRVHEELIAGIPESDHFSPERARIVAFYEYHQVVIGQNIEVLEMTIVSITREIALLEAQVGELVAGYTAVRRLEKNENLVLLNKLSENKKALHEVFEQWNDSARHDSIKEKYDSLAQTIDSWILKVCANVDQHLRHRPLAKPKDLGEKAGWLRCKDYRLLLNYLKELDDSASPLRGELKEHAIKDTTAYAKNILVTIENYWKDNLAESYTEITALQQHSEKSEAYAVIQELEKRFNQFSIYERVFFYNDAMLSELSKLKEQCRAVLVKVKGAYNDKVGEIVFPIVVQGTYERTLKVVAVARPELKSSLALVAEHTGVIENIEAFYQHDSRLREEIAVLAQEVQTELASDDPVAIVKSLMVCLQGVSKLLSDAMTNASSEVSERMAGVMEGVRGLQRDCMLFLAQQQKPTAAQPSYVDCRGEAVSGEGLSVATHLPEGAAVGRTMTFSCTIGREQETDIAMLQRHLELQTNTISTEKVLGIINLIKEASEHGLSVLEKLNSHDKQALIQALLGSQKINRVEVQVILDRYKGHCLVC